MYSDLISNGQDINQRGPGGQTPLMNAVLSGQTEVVKALLELGADHKIPEKDGYTPMHGAGFQGLVKNIILTYKRNREIHMVHMIWSRLYDLICGPYIKDQII